MTFLVNKLWANMSSNPCQQILSIFCLLYHFICTGFAAQYNMTGINLIDENDFRVLNFGPVINNSVIEQSIFAAYEGKTRQKCLWECTSTPGCVAYNYGSNRGICQLSNDTSPCALVHEPGFVHHGVSNFRNCHNVTGFNASVTSGSSGEFVVGEQRFLLQGLGNFFLAVRKNGSIHGKVEAYDMAHANAAPFAEMNAYIDGLPNDMVVLMAVIGGNHMSKHGVGQIPVLGSSYTDADIVGKQWWALIGYKGTRRQPWTAEGIESSTAVTRRVTTYFLY